MPLSEPFQLVVQSFRAYAKNFGSPSLVAPGELDGSKDHLLFHVFQRRSEADLEESSVLASSDTKFLRQVVFADGVSLADDRGPLDHVAELADVAGPGMSTERCKAL